MRTRLLESGFATACLTLVVLSLPTAVAAQHEAVQPPPTLSSADDGALQQTLRAVFGEVSAFAKVQATVRSGVVKLAGSAPSSAVRDSAEQIAGGLPGVLYVENAIELPPPPDQQAPKADDGSPSAHDQRAAERLRRIYSRFEDLVAVDVEVAAGVAVLSGEVVSGLQRTKAEELAKSVDGVVFVSNRIEESTDLSKRFLPSVEKVTGWIRDFIVGMPLFLVAVIVGCVFWWIGARVSRMDRLFGRLSDKALVQDVLRQVAKSFFLLIGIFLALEILGATALVGAVLGTAGVVGLALGFAFRDIAENYLASIILSFRQPFRSKDLVEIDGHVGTVIRMTTRETVLLTAEGNHLMLPNAHVFKSAIVNFTRAPMRRFDVAVGVGTDVDLTYATELGLSVLGKMPGVVDDPAPFARVESLGDSSVTIRFYGWVDQRRAEYTKVQSAAVRLVKGVMDENGVDMPVPMYQIDLLRTGRGDPEETKPIARSSVHDDAALADVSLERNIEKQVDDELRKSDETDLLEAEQPAHARAE